MDKIYILKNNKILVGPFTIEKLVERTVRPNDLIWYEGLADWIEAEKIPALHIAITAAKTEEPKSSNSFIRRITKLFSGSRQ